MEMEHKRTKKKHKKKSSIIAKSKKMNDGKGAWGGRGGGIELPYSLYAARMFETSYFQGSNYNLGMA